ncbi:MAG: enoyl-CoA hydratase [Chitinophagaceae bacterium]|nr:MAG: enoyl-CoA hydratase [Chitinophagaceae bacterium]
MTDITQLLIEKDNGIAVVTINKEQKMNALNRKLVEELNHVFTELKQDKEVVGVILTGKGQKAFAAGADISEFTGLDESQAYNMSKEGHDTFNLIENFPKPVIAAVNGFALGGGCELAMACHFRYASENAKFGQPEVNLGIVPGYGGTQRLIALVGRGRAAELMMTGNMIDAQEAYRIGLVNKVTDIENLLEASKKTINTIAAKAPLAVTGVIECVNAFSDRTLDGMERERNVFAGCASTEDFKEGATAFMEKRKANFKGA